MPRTLVVVALHAECVGVFEAAGVPVPTGSLVACSEFIQRDMDVRGLGCALGITPFDTVPSIIKFEPVFKHLPSAVCGSGDTFATAATDMDCAVVDMEAYALAKVCWREQAQFGCAKYVTDGADQAAAEDWQSNVHKAADAFLGLYSSLER